MIVVSKIKMPSKPSNSKTKLPKSLGFKNFIESANPPLPPVLPLVHMTDAYQALKIFTSGEILANKCVHFSKLLSTDELLSYFFYGRASYRSKNRPTIASGAEYPVAIVLRIDPSYQNPRRVFPFDTGAHFHEMYEDFLHKKMPIMDFNLGSSLEIAQKAVFQFFGSNLDYIQERPKKDLKLDPADFDVLSFHNLITGTAKSEVDSRRSSIEIQYGQSIELVKTKLVAVILPEILRSSPTFSNLLKPFGIRPSFYVLNSGSAAENDGVLISESTKLLKRHAA
jgi:hypothetical protein